MTYRPTFTTAAKLGRRGIGIEVNPTHFATACARIEAALNGTGGLI